MTNIEFIDELIVLRSNNSLIAKKQIFDLAKKHKNMPTKEVIKLLRNSDYDQRLGAVSILDWKARNTKISDKEKAEIYTAYVENHKWIDDWGLVDRAAPYVVGGYLYDKDRKPLYKLAMSKLPMERRTAIVSTYYFIRKNDIQDTFKISEILVHDQDKYVQMAVGSWIREAGKKDITHLTKFLDKYASTMNRKCLRYAIEKLDSTSKQKYLHADSKNASR
ncbi:3-methyladenine DNA glycosylase AlkD [Algoriphagus sp. 4150]|uniref:DNA alkylation repair protein n=1 Tax=Algoriphagus sp. 4150 TaxID=2817756 RepID=UPI002865CC56|nr:DNA alkylation repair protein [Algoriphagus sp. 4150]MDR7128139.1 3-methyladenine DNA glycosylase AlkD [Algoriphagus sp. 4150]